MQEVINKENTVNEPVATTTTTAPPAAASTPVSAAPATSAPAAATPSLMTGDAAKAAVTAPVIPEKYEFAKPKDGAMVPDDEAELVAEAKALGLNQEQAQKFYDARLASHKSANESITMAQAQFRAQAMQTVMNDPVYGGAKFEASKLNANRLIAQAGEEGKAFAALLAKEGLDVEPTLFRFLAKLGSNTGEGAWLTGQAAPAKPTTGGAFNAAQDAKTFFG